MRKKITYVFLIFVSAFMLNVSAMAFQQRYDRKEDEKENDPFVIEMNDIHVFKFLKNTYFFDIPLEQITTKQKVSFFNENMGFGNKYQFAFNYFLSNQLKFVLIEYIGFYSNKIPEKTFFYKT